MVQSNVTARIRLLEDELGVQLFTRHSRGVKPSDAGLQLLSYSEQIGALFRCITTGVGITLLPDAFVKDIWKERSVAVHDLSPDQAHAEIVFVRRRDRHPTSALSAFLKKVRQISGLTLLDR